MLAIGTNYRSNQTVCVYAAPFVICDYLQEKRQKRRLLAWLVSELTTGRGRKLGPHALLMGECESICRFRKRCALLVCPHLHVGHPGTTIGTGRPNRPRFWRNCVATTGSIAIGLPLLVVLLTQPLHPRSHSITCVSCWRILVWLPPLSVHLYLLDTIEFIWLLNGFFRYECLTCRLN